MTSSQSMRRGSRPWPMPRAFAPGSSAPMSGPTQPMTSATVLWTAGVAASPITKLLGRETDRAGRVSVSPFLDVPGVPDVFVVGDASSVVSDGRPVPGVAQAAIQQGRYVGRLIARQLKGRKPGRPFRYRDKGSMAVVGRNFAILESGRLRTSGFFTWLG